MSSEFSRALGKVISAKRQKLKLSVAEFAEKSKIPLRAAYYYETGDRQPKLEIANRISKTLNINLSDLTDEALKHVQR